MVEDDVLLGKVRDGDMEALSVLFRRYQGQAIRYATRYVAPQAAEDVTAEVVTCMLEAITRGAGPTTSFRAYLFTSIRREIIRARSRARREQPVDPRTTTWKDDATPTAAAVAMAHADHAPPTDFWRWSSTSNRGVAADPAQAAIRSADRRALTEAMLTLPPRTRTVLWHSIVDGHPYGQISQWLNMSPDAAMAAASRGRKRLRQSLQHSGARPHP